MPDIDIENVVTLGKVWDGDGEAPSESYCYNLDDYYYINYGFKVLEENELDTIVKITYIEII